MRRVRVLLSAVILVMFGAVACNRAPTPPTPLAVEQIPAELQKAFAKATPEVKEQIAQVVTGLEKKDYPAAHLGIQSLFNLPVATKEQRSVTTRSMMTITSLLQAAQAQGDQNAAAVLTLQKKLK